jgi:hypothetical protein
MKPGHVSSAIAYAAITKVLPLVRISGSRLWSPLLLSYSRTDCGLLVILAAQQ